MTNSENGIAIVGMACLFPRAAGLRAFWENILLGIDAIGDPPPDWGGMRPSPSTRRTPTDCIRSGVEYLGDLARFDPVAFGVMPRAVDGAEPEHFLALRVAHEALADAGYLERAFDRERTAVILGRGTYVNRGYGTVFQHAVAVDQVVELLRTLHPEHSGEELARLRQELRAGLPPFNAETAPGLAERDVAGASRTDSTSWVRPSPWTRPAPPRWWRSIWGSPATPLRPGAGRRCEGEPPYRPGSSSANWRALSRSGQIRPFHPMRTAPCWARASG